MGHFVPALDAAARLWLRRPVPRHCRASAQDLLPRGLAKRGASERDAQEPVHDSKVVEIFCHCGNRHLLLPMVSILDLAHAGVFALALLHGSWKLDSVHPWIWK